MPWVRIKTYPLEDANRLRARTCSLNHTPRIIRMLEAVVDPSLVEGVTVNDVLSSYLPVFDSARLIAMARPIWVLTGIADDRSSQIDAFEEEGDRPASDIEYRAS